MIDDPSVRFRGLADVATFPVAACPAMSRARLSSRAELDLVAFVEAQHADPRRSREFGPKQMVGTYSGIAF